MTLHAKSTPDLRKEIVRMKVSRMTLSAISRDIRSYKIVVSRVLKLYEESKGFEPKKAIGGPSKTNMRNDRAMKRYVLMDPFSLFSTRHSIGEYISICRRFHICKVLCGQCSGRANAVDIFRRDGNMDRTGGFLPAFSSPKTLQNYNYVRMGPDEWKEWASDI
ncbi:Hypothetical predicted protein [Octopus vulgaris]|uniref:Uncharacterized protein n=1 Tax=Octopus vulgaris TaxID=6645 RepID=A0AA36ALF0_OCTVU|nr:Hypothetical predicted protein [Octopus vulgaris]